MAERPELERDIGQRLLHGGVETLYQIQQVRLVLLELPRVREPARVHLKVQVTCFDELCDEGSDHRLQVIQPKRLEGERQHFASYGVPTEEGVHTPTL